MGDPIPKRLSRRDFLKFAAIGFGAVATACAPPVIAQILNPAPTPGNGLPPTRVPEIIPPTPTNVPEFPTPTPRPPEASPTPSIDKVKVPSPYVAAGLYIGTYGMDKGKPITDGAVSVAQFKAAGHEQNGFKNVPFGNGESRSVTMYMDADGKRDMPAAMMISQDWLDTSLKAQSVGNKTVGSLPNGKQIEKEGTTWYLLNAQGVRTGETFVTVLPNRKPAKFGWPLLAMKGNELYMGLAAADGNLLDGETFHPAFQKPADIAQNQAQYKGNVSQLTALDLDYDGKMRLRDLKGDILQTVKYIGDSDTMFGKWVAESIKTPDFGTNLQAAEQVYATATGKAISTLALDSQVRLDKDGKPYGLVVDKDTDGATPLMITDMEKGVWEDNTLKPTTNIVNGSALGTAVNTSEPYKTPAYQETVTANFDAIFPDGDFYQNTIDKWGTSKADFNVNFARENGLTLFIHPGFNRYDQDYLEKAQPAERLDKLKERARTILSFVTKIDSNTQKPAFVTMFNEPFGRYINGSGQDIASWKVESLAQQTMGNDTLIQSYIIFYEAAKERGLELGKDLHLQFSEYGISTDNPKYRMALREIKRAKTEIAKRLGISIDEVKFGLALEQRYDEKNPRDLPDPDAGTGRVRPPTEAELETTTGEFLKTVDFINFTECSDNPATSEQRQTRFKALLATGKKLGVKNIVFENPLRFTNEEPDMTYKGTDLFTPRYGKSKEYYLLARDTLSLAT